MRKNDREFTLFMIAEAMKATHMTHRWTRSMIFQMQMRKRRWTKLKIPQVLHQRNGPLSKMKWNIFTLERKFAHNCSKFSKNAQK